MNKSSYGKRSSVNHGFDASRRLYVVFAHLGFQEISSQGNIRILYRIRVQTFHCVAAVSHRVYLSESRVGILPGASSNRNDLFQSDGLVRHLPPPETILGNFSIRFLTVPRDMARSFPVTSS